MQRIEVVTSVRRKRRFTAEQKKQVVDDGLQPGSSLSAAARKYAISPSLVFQWRRLMENGQLAAVGSEEEVVPVSEVKKLEQRVRELERVLGKKTMQVEILTEAVRIGREKKLISRSPLPGLEDGQ